MTTNEPLKPRAPYELVPTSLPNVFTSPPPPVDFDPNTASPEELIKNGILWPRPSEKDAPALRAAWDSFFSRWREKKLLTYKFEPHIGNTHIRRGGLTQVGPGLYENNQWAGSIVLGKWQSATGTWSVPTVSKPIDPPGIDEGWDASSWVGISGKEDVLQAGVRQHIMPDGTTTSHYAWIEWYTPGNLPDGSYSQDFLTAYPYIYETKVFDVKPGEKVGVWVAYNENHTKGQIQFLHWETPEGSWWGPLIEKDPPQSSLHPITFSGISTEWFMEAPGDGIPQTSLPKFTPVEFSTAYSVNLHTLGDPSVPPPSGNTYYIKGFGRQLTSVKNSYRTCTITYL